MFSNLAKTLSPGKTKEKQRMDNIGSTAKGGGADYRRQLEKKRE